MFPIETLPSQYYEERAAAVEAARQLAQQQKEAAVQAQNSAPAATLPRPGSSSVLGNIFQGFAKRASSTPASSGTATPVAPATQAAQKLSLEREKREMEALLAEMHRDTDRYCALPSWH
ncbi:hypothetical protein LTR37_012182 [Vermiconidia calcicola]|uniref:Uncharacterized protein n=1 Tax=Vermiconidia calcicola TaxID=1690605 RepID=A0ACC3N006_9PEZI|nr:hypothetical protein LTR37_012182 [Vermiconidia calcicola]